MKESDSLIEIFCFVDDFCKKFIPYFHTHLIENGLKQRRKTGNLTASEVITLFIFFQMSGFKNFKTFYLRYALVHLKNEFPNLVSYSHFVRLISWHLLPFCALVYGLCAHSAKTGIYFIDSLPIKVSHIKREKQNRVFKLLAKKGKSSMGWFFGFKLHLVINNLGQIMNLRLTPGNVDDRSVVDRLVTLLEGKLFGDKGYLSKDLFYKLFAKGLQLVTKIKKNMKKVLYPLLDYQWLRKRSLIECVNDQLKNTYQIEHSRHRSPWNFFAHVLASVSAYCFQQKKPSILSPSNLSLS